MLLKQPSGKRRSLPALDGIRGMAFLFVICSHLSINYGLFFRGIGKYGVYLFFILSAFLLTYYFINKPEKATEPLEWANYIVRRFFRIYPAYIIAVTIYIFVFIHGSVNLWLKHLTLRAGINHLWSIPVEFKFYFLLPFVVFFFLFMLKRNLYLTIASTITFVLIYHHLHPLSHYKTGTINLQAYIIVFIMGSATAVVHYHLTQFHLSKRIRNVFECVAIAMLAGIVLTFPSVWSIFFGHIYNGYFQNRLFMEYGFGWAIFILCVVHGKGYLRRFFSSKIMSFFGWISFSAYLFHPMFMIVVNQWLGWGSPIFGNLLIAAMTFVFSYFMYRIVEAPSTKVNLFKVMKKRREIQSPEKAVSIYS